MCSSDLTTESHLKKLALHELKIINQNRELAVKYQLANRNARLEEREHIARNIHNVVGHTITSAIVSLNAYNALKDIDPERSTDKLIAAQNRMQLSLEEIRRVVRVLDEESTTISMPDFCNLLTVQLEQFSMDTQLQTIHNFNTLGDKIGRAHV